MTKQQKRAIVIGASSGIGRGLAQQLVADGYQVGIVARRSELLEELARSQPTNYYVQTLDVTETSAIEPTMDTLVKRLGGLDLIVVGAGMTLPNKEYEQSRKTYALNCNVVGFAILTNWAYQYFARQGYGHIVGLSSVAGARGWRQSTQYNASKAFQINYLEGMYLKAKKEYPRIHVTDIRPGYVETAIMAKKYTFWVVQVHDVVPLILRAIRLKKRIAYVPSRWRWVYYLYKMIPTWLLQKG